jgi:hypothetical protein
MRTAHVRALLLSGLLLGVAVGLPACTPEAPVVVGPGPNPYPPVPPPRAEERPLPPVSEDQLVWRMGQWEWVGSGYVWRGGEWEKLDGHSNQYLPGHWAVLNGAWQWERGHWL